MIRTFTATFLNTAHAQGWADKLNEDRYTWSVVGQAERKGKAVTWTAGRLIEDQMDAYVRDCKLFLDLFAAKLEHTG